MTPIISTAQHLSLTGPEHCPFWELLGVGGGHGFRGVISEGSDGIMEYIIHKQLDIKGKKTAWEGDMIWVRYGWRERGDPACHGAATRQYAGLSSGSQAPEVYKPLVTMLFHILTSFWAPLTSMEEGIWIGVNQSPLLELQALFLRSLVKYYFPTHMGWTVDFPSAYI